MFSKFKDLLYCLKNLGAKSEKFIAPGELKLHETKKISGNSRWWKLQSRFNFKSESQFSGQLNE